MDRDGLFVAVERGYAAGVRKTVPSVPQDINDIDALLAGLPVEDAARIQMATGVYQQALKAAREGDIAQAKRFFRIVLSMLPLEKMSRESRFVALNLIKPVESYIHYKQNDYHRARELMEEALSCANVLRDEFEYPSMDARRVHLACNVMRLESCLGEVGRAASIGFKLLHYVEGDNGAWPLASLACEASDVLMSAPMRTAMFNQASWELAMLFANSGEANSAAALEAGERTAAQSRTEGSHRIELLSLWTQAKKALVKGDRSAFLAVASRFFFDGSGTLAFWEALAADVCGVCAEDDGREARSLQKTIMDDIGVRKKFQQLMSIREQSLRLSKD